MGKKVMLKKTKEVMKCNFACAALYIIPVHFGSQ